MKSFRPALSKVRLLDMVHRFVCLREIYARALLAINSIIVLQLFSILAPSQSAIIIQLLNLMATIRIWMPNTI